MPTRLSAGPLQVTSLDLTSVNYMLQQVRRELDEIKGLRGTSQFLGDVHVVGNMTLDGTLPWLTSGITGTASTVAAFGATGATAVLTRTGSGTVVALQTLPTLITPIISDFSYATHTHQNTTGGGTLDHGLALTGLADDDHSAYLLASSATSRAFFAASWIDLTDGGASTLHSHAAGAVDHGALTGLADDDHTQYLLASAATDRATFAANWTDLTDAGATTLHSHASSGVTGSGTAGRVAFWDGAASLSSDTDLTFSGATLTASLLNLPTTTSAVGQILINSVRVIHFYGTESTFIGAACGNFDNSVGYNTAIGSQCMPTITSGYQNTAIGRYACNLLSTGIGNVAIGSNALAAVSSGNRNVAIGTGVLGSLTTASDIIAIGQDALVSQTSGPQNVAIGSNALRGITTGGYNVAVGFDAGQGGAGLASNFNTIVGRSAMYGLGEADSNSAFGFQALYNTSTGDNNTGLGQQAGTVNTTGSNNTYCGFLAEAGSNNLSNSGAFGANAIVASSNYIMLGDAAVCVGIGGAARPTGSKGLIFGDGTALSSMASNTAGLYADDVGGTVNMFAINEAGTVTQLTGGFNGTVTPVASITVANGIVTAVT